MLSRHSWVRARLWFPHQLGKGCPGEPGSSPSRRAGHCTKLTRTSHHRAAWVIGAWSLAMFWRDFGIAGGLGLIVAERRHRRVQGGVGGGWRLAVSGSSGGRGGGQAGLGKGEFKLVRMRRGHGERNPADRDADQGADLEERE